MLSTDILHPRFQDRAVHPQRHCSAALPGVAFRTLADQVFVAVDDLIRQIQFVTISDADNVANLHKTATSARLAPTAGTFDDSHPLLRLDGSVRCGERSRLLA
jgi:hypothetical protein